MSASSHARPASHAITGWGAFGARGPRFKRLPGTRRTTLLVSKIPDEILLRRFAELTLERGEVPTEADLNLKRKEDWSFPGKPVFRRWGSRDALLAGATEYCEGKTELAGALEIVLVPREMERGRSPLVSIPPCGRGFSRHEGLPIRCGFFESAEAKPTRWVHRLDEPRTIPQHGSSPRSAASVSSGRIVLAPPPRERPTSECVIRAEPLRPRSLTEVDRDYSTAVLLVRRGFRNSYVDHSGSAPQNKTGPQLNA